MRVLIVDDDHSVVQAMVKLLESAGHTTCWSHTGEGALELVRTETDIEAILLDVNLGKGIDGIEVARRLPRGIPLIIVSGLPFQEIHARATQSTRALDAALVMLDKPIDVQRLLKILQQLSNGAGHN